jgi:hypothetical protein
MAQAAEHVDRPKFSTVVLNQRPAAVTPVRRGHFRRHGAQSAALGPAARWIGGGGFFFAAIACYVAEKVDFLDLDQDVEHS